MGIAIIKQISSLFELDGGWVLVALIALFAYKLLKEKYEAKRQHRTETLKSLKEFIDSDKQNKDPFLRELLFENHFGQPLSCNEIEFFMAHTHPNKYLKMYLLSRQYLEVSNNGTDLNTRKGKNLTRAKWGYMIGYFVFGILALLMLLSAKTAFSVIGPELYAPWTIVTLSLAAVAWAGLDESISANIANKLINEMNKFCKADEL